jgi:hypothetical protein
LLWICPTQNRPSLDNAEGGMTQVFSLGIPVKADYAGLLVRLGSLGPSGAGQNPQATGIQRPDLPALRETVAGPYQWDLLREISNASACAKGPDRPRIDDD